MEVRHPYFKDVQITVAGVALVSLSDAFPIDSFTVTSTRSLWEGLEEVMADIVFIHENGESNVIAGSGETFEEAVEDALITFLNLVVHPEGLSKSRFVRTSEVGAAGASGLVR